MRRHPQLLSCTCTCRFSHDRGNCFKPEDIDTTGSFKVTKGLLMDPLGLGMFAFALGLEGTDIDDMWRLIAIDFHSILDSPCEFTNIQVHVHIHVHVLYLYFERIG